MRRHDHLIPPFAVVVLDAPAQLGEPDEAA
jgi:hypothetical protein